jgi:hypothetical protein
VEEVAGSVAAERGRIADVEPGRLEGRVGRILRSPEVNVVDG